MIAKGTEITATVTGSVREGFLSPMYSAADLRNDVTERIRNSAEIVSFQIDADDSMWTETWSYSAVVTVRTLFNHASENDVVSIIQGAFWQASNVQPIVTLGANSQQSPVSNDPSTASTLSMIAIIIIGAIVLIVFAKP